MKNKNFQLSKWSIILCSFLVLFSYSCNNDDDVLLDDGQLRLLQTAINDVNIKDNSENLSIDPVIVLTFSHELDTQQFTQAFNLNSMAGTVNYDLQFSNTNSTVTVAINEDLEYSTDYLLNLPAGEYGLNGESLENPISLKFITAAFVPPMVKLSTDAASIVETNQTATVTATLNKITDDEVIVYLEFGGMATLDVDYKVSNDSIVIPVGQTTGNITVSSILDAEVDANEEILISIESVVNADENGMQQVSILIKEELSPLSLKGVLALTFDGSGTNDGKAVHVVANEDIADLSIYGLGVANNGGGTDGREYDFPAISVNKGDDILVSRMPAILSAYFGSCASEFEVVLEVTSTITQNGDDAIELFNGETLIEVYGDSDVDGTGLDWEYSGSWAYKTEGIWTTGGLDCSVGSTTTQDSNCIYPICKEALELKGVLAILWDGSGSNGGKAIHLKVNKDIADLSIYSIGVANNGGGTDGEEFIFPAISVSEGDDILLAREKATLAGYFGACVDSFEVIIESNDAVAQNGDDAIELFINSVVLETYGDPDIDGTGLFWEYSGSWAYKNNGSWTTGGLDCAAGSTSTQESDCPYPTCE